MPLAGVRVLDLSRLLPGPFCTLLLRRLGAEIIKIEAPVGGDYLRHMPPMLDRHGAVFEALNGGKRGLCLNLKHADGAAVLKRLVRHADVLVESFRPGVMSRLGVDYAALAEQNPALVYCAISGYGQDGPYALRAGHDLNYMAIAGALGINGPTSDSPPGPLGVQVADIAGGALNGVVGILAGLFDAGRSGQGRFVDVSMTEGALQFLLPAFAALFSGEAPPGRGEGMLDGGQAAYRTYLTKDEKHLAVGALEPQFWQAFCVAVDRPDLLPKQYQDSGPGGALQGELEALISSKARAEWEQIFAELDACTEPVLSLEETRQHPQHAARGVFVGEGQGTQLVVGPRVDTAAPLPLSPAPDPGQHSAEVLEGAGFTTSEIEALFSKGVVTGAG